MAGIPPEQLKHEYDHIRDVDGELVLDTLIQIESMNLQALALQVPNLPVYRSVRTFDIIEQLLYIERLQYWIQTYRKKYEASLKSIDAYYALHKLKKHDPKADKEEQIAAAFQRGLLLAVDTFHTIRSGGDVKPVGRVVSSLTDAPPKTKAKPRISMGKPESYDLD